MQTRRALWAYLFLLPWLLGLALFWVGPLLAGQRVLGAAGPDPDHALGSDRGQRHADLPGRPPGRARADDGRGQDRRRRRLGQVSVSPALFHGEAPFDDAIKKVQAECAA